MKTIALRALYSEYYEAAQRILSTHNPCAVKDGKCVDGAFCCSGCKHLGPQGCTVSALSCKVWLCYTARCTPNGERAAAELDALRDAAKREIPWRIRASEDETFEKMEQANEVSSPAS